MPPASPMSNTSRRCSRKAIATPASRNSPVQRTLSLASFSFPVVGASWYVDAAPCSRSRASRRVCRRAAALARKFAQLRPWLLRLLAFAPARRTHGRGTTVIRWASRYRRREILFSLTSDRHYRVINIPGHGRDSDCESWHESTVNYGALAGAQELFGGVIDGNSD